MAGATRRNSANDDDAMDQQALMSLMAEPSRSTQPVPTLQPSFTKPADNSGVTGGMDKTISGPTGTLNGSASGAKSSWDTDGFAAPQYTPEKFGGVMSGWDEKKWGNPDNQHPKYVIGRILSNYAPTIQNAPKAAEDIARAYPGTTYNGKDRITVPGVGSIDFLKGAGNGGEAWQYGIEDGSGATQGAAPAAAMAGPDGLLASNAVQGLTQGSTYQKLLQYLNSIAGPEATDQQALMSLMQ